MPREFQKRGKRSKHREVEIVKEVAPEPRLPSPVAVEETVTDSEWPQLDAETRAYFVQINQRITELEQLGVGRGQEAGEQLDENDERVLIIRGSLATLNGHEVELATDPEASFVLERLLYSMDDFAKRVLADRFIGQYAQLARNTFACHVLTTLFYLGSFTVDRETRGIIASGPSTSVAELRTMTELLSTACSELIPDVSQHLYDSHASHLLRSALALLTGTSFPEEPEGAQLRSKSNRKFVKGRAPLQSLTKEGDSGKGKQKERVVPSEFEEVKAQLFDALDEALGKGGSGTEARLAGANPVAMVVVQMLLTWEAEQGLSEQPDSLLDRLLEGLVSSLANDENPERQRSDFVETLLRDAASSHLLEVILSCAPLPVFEAIWSIYYVARLDKLAIHPVSNFTVTTGIARLDSERLEAVIKELHVSGSPHFMLENSRSGPLRAMAERAASLGRNEDAVCQLLQRALAVSTPAQQQWLVMCLLGLSPVDFLKDTHRSLSFANPLEPTLQGSLLGQAWLQLAWPANEPLLESVLTAPIEYLLELCRSPIASRMLDVVLDASAVPRKQKRRFVMRLLDHYHELADDRIGSRVADRCWQHADVYLKEKIARSLLPHIVALSGSKIGHHFARKLQLPLYERKPSEWKNKMTALQQSTAEPKVEKKRNAEGAGDIDAIFASKKVKR